MNEELFTLVWGITPYEMRWRDIPLTNQRRFQYAKFQLDAAIAHYVHGSGDAFKTRLGWMRGPYPTPETGEQP